MAQVTSRRPVVLVTGTHAEAVAVVTDELCRDLPAAVSIQHRCLDGEPWLPGALAALARVRAPDQTVIVGLPPQAAAADLEESLAADPELSQQLHVSSVIAALPGAGTTTDLLTGDPAACALVEYADAVIFSGPADPTAFDLVVALARPDALVVRASAHLPAGLMTSGRHDSARSLRWAAARQFAERASELPLLPSPRVWRLDLVAPRPIHPGRLLERLAAPRAAPHRARGCFWLPTRPGHVFGWSGTGGRVAVTPAGSWGRCTPQTRLVLTGVGTLPDDLSQGFHELLTGPFELALRDWWVAEDGFEVWLGAILGVA